MLQNYSHYGIWINGREVSFQNIRDSKVQPVDNFEASTFDFIQQWMAGADTFKLTTSGSTGTPKEIVITRNQMIASAKATALALKLKSEYNALVCLDTNFIAGKMMLVRSFVTGMKIIAETPSANPLSKIPIDKTLHFAALVPYQVQATLESKHPQLLDRLLTCIIGGASISLKLIESLQQTSCCFYSTYGMTETISHIALQCLNGKDQSPYYTALPGVRISTDHRGCLVINTNYLPDDIITNDLVELKGENSFQWIGRWDNLINSGGIKVNPEVLEERIGQIFTRNKYDQAFFVYGLPDEKLGQKIILVVEGGTTDTSLFTALQSAFRQSFKSYEIPKEFFSCSQFTRTPTGKINRSESMKNSTPVRL